MNITKDQRNSIRSYFVREIDTLSRMIDEQISDIGGKDMLLQRLDVFEVVNTAEEEIRMYQETVRYLDGAKKVDMRLVQGAYLRHSSQYQRGVDEIERLKKEIQEREQLVRQTEEKMPEHKLIMDVLGEMLREDSK